MLEGPFFDSPLLFVEKQVVSVTIPDAYVTEGDRVAIPYTYCEVYAPVDIMTNVSRHH